MVVRIQEVLDDLRLSGRANPHARAPPPPGGRAPVRAAGLVCRRRRVLRTVGLDDQVRALAGTGAALQEQSQAVRGHNMSLPSEPTFTYGGVSAVNSAASTRAWMAEWQGADMRPATCVPVRNRRSTSRPQAPQGLGRLAPVQARVCVSVCQCVTGDNR